MNNSQSPTNNSQFVRNSVEAAISIGLVIILVYWCFDIVKPFITPMIWGTIITVAIYPHYKRLENVLGGRKILAATL